MHKMLGFTINTSPEFFFHTNCIKSYTYNSTSYVPQKGVLVKLPEGWSQVHVVWYRWPTWQCSV